MARVPITVYLLPEQLAGIERRAAQVGKQRSAWVADTLVRALNDECATMAASRIPTVKWLAMVTHVSLIIFYIRLQLTELLGHM